MLAMVFPNFLLLVLWLSAPELADGLHHEGTAGTGIMEMDSENQPRSTNPCFATTFKSAKRKFIGNECETKTDALCKPKTSTFGM